jgi:hypothetical protein
MQRLRDIKSSGRQDVEAPAATGGPVASFDDLFDRIITCMDLPLTPLLLYNLLIHCPNFSNFVLVRADIDALIVPLLEQLYSAPPEHRPRIYLLQVRTGWIPAPEYRRTGHIQTSASDFLGKQTHQAWARMPKKYLKSTNI